MPHKKHKHDTGIHFQQGKSQRPRKCFQRALNKIQRGVFKDFSSNVRTMSLQKKEKTLTSSQLYDFRNSKDDLSSFGK